MCSDLENLASEGNQTQIDTAAGAEDSQSNIAFDYFVCVKKNDAIYDIDEVDNINFDYQV